MSKKAACGLKIACWNVRTLQDNNASLERKTAIVARVLGNYNIDIAALSETRFPGTGELEEVSGGYTYFWSGKPPEENRQSGVGFAIRTEIARNLESLPTGVNDRLMTLRLSTENGQHITLISCYAPTMTNSEQKKESFYTNLRTILSSVPYHDQIILLGDFNARVGKEDHIWPGVLGRHGIGKMNTNRLLLLSLCSEFDLAITNTLFQQANKHKTSWKHPRSNHWHMLDYVIVRRRDIKSVHQTRSMCTAEYLSDHKLIRSKFSFPFVPKKRIVTVKMPKKVNVALLKDPAECEVLAKALNDKLASCDTSGDIESSWKSLRDCIYETSSEVLGFVKRKHKDWFDENDQEIQHMLQAMHTAHKAWISDKNSSAKKQLYLTAKRESQRRLRKMKETWWRQRAEELQVAADTHNAKAFYEGLRAVYGPKSTGNSPVYSSDNETLLTDRDKILQRWADHFENVLNSDSVVDNDVIGALPQRPILQNLSGNPTISEVKLAIKQLTNGKAPGKDGIPGEIFKKGGHVSPRSSQNYSVLFGKSGMFLRNIKMLPSSVFSKIKVVALAAMIIVVYPYSQSLERSLLG